MKADPMGAAPSRKLIWPVGRFNALEDTVAVKVTDCPGVDGFTEETSAVVEVPRTNCVKEKELGWKFVSPLYSADTE
jgi:hypothetical protein